MRNLGLFRDSHDIDAARQAVSPAKIAEGFVTSSSLAASGHISRLRFSRGPSRAGADGVRAAVDYRAPNSKGPLDRFHENGSPREQALALPRHNALLH
jgi:hypothetical protein